MLFDEVVLDGVFAGADAWQMLEWMFLGEVEQMESTAAYAYEHCDISPLEDCRWSGAFESEV